MAPGTAETLRALRNRPATARDDIPELPRDLTAFNLDEDLFNKNVRTARKGVAGGPSGMTHDHLRPLLESPKDLQLFFAVCDFLAKGQVPREAVNGIKLGRMTALRKENGGVRGIVAREVVRRVTAKTIAQQLGPAVKAATAPYQYALSTRAGCECIAHALQAVTELEQEATVTTIDGISAYDSISRRAMLLGLDRVAGGRQALPFVRLFYSEPSAYLWEDASGTVHTVHQGEGGEQGDPLMPLLFSVGQHAALEAIQRRLFPTEKLLAFLDDIYVVSRPERVGDVVASADHQLWTHARIRVHGGKIHVWNRAGTKPEACDVLQQRAEALDPDTRDRVWRGSEVPTTKQGIKVLGTPLGHEDFVRGIWNVHVRSTGFY